MRMPSVNKIQLCFMCLSLLATLTCVFAQTQKLDINTASVEELAAAMQGVGPKKAAAIVEYRKKHGPFNKIDDIVKVKGIGPVTLQKNRAKITVGNIGCRGCKATQEKP